jgi:hypothetical protein
LALACASPPAEPILVRGGYVSTDPSGGKRFVAYPWAPGEAVVLSGTTLRGPLRPACVPLFSVDLGDVSRQVARTKKTGVEMKDVRPGQGLG